MIKKISVLIFILITLKGVYKAQTVPSPSEVNLDIELINSQVISESVLDTLTDPFYLLTGEDSLSIGLSLVLSDTNQVNYIHIKLGTAPGTSDLFTYTFTYDDTNLTGNLSYTRTQHFIKLGLGVFSNVNNGVFYSEVEIEDGVGNKSTLVQTNSSNN